MRLIYIIIQLCICTSLQMYSQSFEVSPVEMSFNAEPGQTQTNAITITNHGNTKGSYSVVLGDFIVNKEGQKINMPAATTDHSLVNWISINPPFIELEPNETRQIIVSTQAPVGDYTTRWANIYVRSTKEQTASLADKNLSTGLVLHGQILIRVYQSPKSNMNYKMKITGLTEITNINDTIRRFKAKIDNIGDKITHCKVTLLASDLSTAKETVLDVIDFGSLPESQLEIILKMNKMALPKGNYALAAVLDYGSQSNLEGTQIIIDVE